MKTFLKGIVKYLLPVFVTFLIVYLIYKNFDLKRFNELIENIKATEFILGFLLYIMIHVVKGIRFKTAGAKAEIIDLFGIASVNVLLTRILPFRLGEFTYAYILKKIKAGPLTEGLVQLILMRVTDILSVIIIFFLGIALMPFSTKEKVTELNYIMVGIFLFLGIITLLIYTYITELLSSLLKIVDFLLFTHFHLSKKLKDSFQSIKLIVEEASNLTKVEKLKLLLTTSLVWVLYYLLFHMILQFIDISFPFILTLVGSSIAITASFIPISAIGTFGLLEGGWWIGFNLCGMDKKLAITSGIIMSGLTLIYAIINFITGSLLLLLRYYKREKKLKKERFSLLNFL